MPAHFRFDGRYRCEWVSVDGVVKAIFKPTSDGSLPEIIMTNSSINGGLPEQDKEYVVSFAPGFPH